MLDFWCLELFSCLFKKGNHLFSLLHCVNKWSLECPLTPVSSAVTLYAISSS